MAIFMKKPFTKSRKGNFSILSSLIEINAIKVGYLNMDKHEQIG